MFYFYPQLPIIAAPTTEKETAARYAYRNHTDEPVRVIIAETSKKMERHVLMVMYPSNWGLESELVHASTYGRRQKCVYEVNGKSKDPDQPMKSHNLIRNLVDHRYTL